MTDKAKDQELQKLKKLLDEKSFDKAEQLLGKSSSLIEEPIKLYNFAFIQYEKGELAQARYFLEKAQINGLFSKELDDSLTVIKGKLDLTRLEEDYSGVDIFLLKTTNYSSDVFISLIGVFLLLGLLGILKRFLTAGITAFGICIALGGFLYSTANLQTYINLEETTVYRGPSRIFEEVQVLSPGMKFIVSKETKDWKYISYPEGFKGWVYKNKGMQL